MTDAKLDGETVMEIAREVARRYKRRCWWADVDDMAGQASVAILEAQRTWDPQVGVPLEGYVRRAAVLSVKGLLWRTSSPCSGGLGDPRRNLAELRRVPDDHAPATARPDMEGKIDTERLCARVRARVAELAARTRDGQRAVPVLVGETTASDGPREERVATYKAVELVRRKARADAEMYRLWSES